MANDVFPAAVDRAAIRDRFPALVRDTVFLENAGGSQVPAVVANGMRDYMLETYVQLGAGYETSRRCTRVVDEAHEFVRTLFGAEGGHVVMAASSSTLVRVLAEGYSGVLRAGQEIVLAESAHEANVGPWLRLERSGVKIRWWRVDPADGECRIEDLESLLSERTAIVAFPHVSNLLGGVVDVATITAAAHRVGARVVVDGVAYAPHRAMDVEKWDVDWYFCSLYKVYGPHLGAIWAKDDAIREIPGPNHFFIRDDDLPYKFEVGGVPHEACAGLLGLAEYFAFLGGRAGPTPERADVERAYEVMTACERPVQERLLAYLNAKGDVSVVGPATAGAERVSTVSFRHRRKSSREITAAVDDSGIGIRNGHMYAYRLCRALGIDPEDGVVRISPVHYNTTDEIDRLIEVLEPIL